jgi:hypothetical protein
MHNMDIDQNPQVDDFKRTAEQFCILVEALNHTDRNSFLFKVYLILPKLISGGASLPVVSYEEDPEDDKISRPGTRLRDAEWRQLYESLKKKLKPNDIYWFVPECWKGIEALTNSLADDIADIYRDMKDGLNERDTRDMNFEWRLGFYSHWGNHATGALKAIHDLMAEREMV